MKTLKSSTQRRAPGVHKNYRWTKHLLHGTLQMSFSNPAKRSDHVADHVHHDFLLGHGSWEGDRKMIKTLWQLQVEAV